MTNDLMKETFMALRILLIANILPLKGLTLKSYFITDFTGAM